jgi:hypothetical protein
MRRRMQVMMDVLRAIVLVPVLVDQIALDQAILVRQHLVRRALARNLVLLAERHYAIRALSLREELYRLGFTVSEHSFQNPRKSENYRQDQHDAQHCGQNIRHRWIVQRGDVVVGNGRAPQI